jgi:hypothetical protein
LCKINLFEGDKAAEKQIQNYFFAVNPTFSINKVGNTGLQRSITGSLVQQVSLFTVYWPQYTKTPYQNKLTILDWRTGIPACL